MAQTASAHGTGKRIFCILVAVLVLGGVLVFSVLTFWNHSRYRPDNTVSAQTRAELAFTEVSNYITMLKRCEPYMTNREWLAYLQEHTAEIEENHADGGRFQCEACFANKSGIYSFAYCVGDGKIYTWEKNIWSVSDGDFTQSGFTGNY